ncbi:MAG: YjfB family protein [Lachnospiraceae bacterium]|nr:YjfB family protein [Lachnospiraceae bacterium]
MDVSMMVTPDIASMSMAMAANKTAQDIGVAMLDKTLDNFRDNGADMVKMMERSVQPNIGGNFDMSV